MTAEDVKKPEGKQETKPTYNGTKINESYTSPTSEEV
jgi:hypothetical protein